MNEITLKLTIEELDVIRDLVEIQAFRKKKMLNILKNIQLYNVSQNDECEKRNIEELTNQRDSYEALVKKLFFARYGRYE